MPQPSHAADTTACQLVLSDIHHTRHAPRAHFLSRAGLSLNIDVDRLADADQQSPLFSVGKWNLLSFYQTDYGPFHKSNHQAKNHPENTHQDQKQKYHNLGDYIRDLATQYGITKKLAKINLLTFPRILGASFNPLSVYRCLDEAGQLVMVVYEVHNTFGEMHSYIGLVTDTGHASLHHTKKIFHVSPFFDVSGDYQLFSKQDNDKCHVIIRYRKDGKLALTATLRGLITPMTSKTIISGLFSQKQWPMRPWFAIHIEAAKLFLKKLTFHSKPTPPGQTHSLSSTKGLK